ncbi:unnamed protein product [Psylliodes chrysocephalus]|uniref:Uncharacterized protein n=1 Tax=Psylliodes chrysocephalus TaxID=3402493 RepID=A0A9P0CDS7_9CUCU|nr:unnamed protein product [Psylliodes chrysocephala]
MVVLSVISKVDSKYVIHHPHPGIYVEHIGHARLDRGIFRIQVNFETARLKQDFKNVPVVVQEFNDLCNKTKALSDETQCTSLSRHLIDQEDQLSWYRSSLPRNNGNRNKRGILGKFLTSVFGVKKINKIS